METATATATATETPPQSSQSASARLRESVCDYLAAALGKRLDGEQIEDVEVGIFNSTIDHATRLGVPRTWRNGLFRTIYQNRARSVIGNLVPEEYVGNSELLERIRSGACDPRDAGELGAQECFPERWEKLIQAKRQRAEYLANAKPAAMTDQFVCARCKQRECTFTEMQMRSCDEPATLFVSCITCGHRWRVG